jgi:hypothetical protein
MGNLLAASCGAASSGQLSRLIVETTEVVRLRVPFGEDVLVQSEMEKQSFR